eukprot:6186213-Pleurochrysis_carterae.AAC.7
MDIGLMMIPALRRNVRACARRCGIVLFGCAVVTRACRVELAPLEAQAQRDHRTESLNISVLSKVPKISYQVRSLCRRGRRLTVLGLRASTCAQSSVQLSSHHISLYYPQKLLKTVSIFDFESRRL